MMYEYQTINIFEKSSSEIPAVMKTDIQEKDGDYLLEIEVPGFMREDILAELVDGTLTIIAKKPEALENKDTGVNYILRERLVNCCKRSFYVGASVKQEDITAAFKDGVLSIIIKNPKKAVEREERKLIPIK